MDRITGNGGIARVGSIAVCGLVALLMGPEARAQVRDPATRDQGGQERSFDPPGRTVGLGVPRKEEDLALRRMREESLFGSDWKVTIGAGAVYKPDYEGSDDYEIVPYPAVRIEYLNTFFLDTERRAIGVKLLDNERFEGGALIRVRRGRKEDDNDALAGLGDIDYAIEPGIYAEAYFGALTVAATVSQDVVAAHEGMVADISVSYDIPPMLDDRLHVRIAASSTVVTQGYNQEYFGISQAQSNLSGLPVFEPTGGFKDAGIQARATYLVTENVGVTGFIGYSRLLGDAKDSPLVADYGSKHQFAGGLAVTYRF